MGHTFSARNPSELSVAATGVTIHMIREAINKKERLKNSAIDLPECIVEASIEQIIELMGQVPKENQLTPDDVSRLFCPITQAVMRDPVTTADGQTYEREAIDMWLQDHNTSPLTNLQLINKELVENGEIRSLMMKLIEIFK